MLLCKEKIKEWGQENPVHTKRKNIYKKVFSTKSKLLNVFLILISQVQPN